MCVVPGGTTCWQPGHVYAFFPVACRTVNPSASLPGGASHPGSREGRGSGRSRAERCRRGTVLLSVGDDEPSGDLPEGATGTEVVLRSTANSEGVISAFHGVRS